MSDDSSHYYPDHNNNGNREDQNDFESESAAVDRLFEICRKEAVFSVDELHRLLQQYPNSAQTLKSCYEWTERTSETYPLHFACQNDAPVSVIRALIKAWPGALQARISKRLPLHEACSHASSSATLQLLVEAWPDSIRQRLEEDDEDSYDYDVFPLHWALKSHHKISLDIIQFLVERWPESLQMETDWPRRNPLQLALAHDQNDNVIQYLVQKWPESIQERDENGAFPLHFACQIGRSLSIVQFLVQSWPDAVRIKANGKIPLLWALQQGTSVETVAFLLDTWPASIKEKDSYDAKTPLLTALVEYYLNVEVISLLIDRWPDAVRISDKKGILPLHQAMLIEAPLAVLELILKTYPDAVRMRDNGGELPLHLALGYGHREKYNPLEYLQFIKLLVKYWPQSIQKKTDNGLLPLHLACQNLWRAFIDIIWYIFLLYPNAVRVQDSQLRLPLHILCERKTIPKKLVKRFVHEWPASIQMAGRYPKYSCIFSPKKDDKSKKEFNINGFILRFKEEAEEEFDGDNHVCENNSLEQDEQRENHVCELDTYTLKHHDDHSDANEESDESENHDYYNAVSNDWYDHCDDRQGCTYAVPLDVLCAARESPSLELIQLLTNGRPPLHFLCKYSRTPWIPTRMNAIKYVASIIPNHVMQIYHGMLPFHWACWSRAPRSVLEWWCEQYQAVVKARTAHTHETPLHCYLASTGIDRNKTATTPLHHMSDSHISTVQYLVEKHSGALSCTNRMGWLPFHVAALHNATLDVLFYLICQNPGVVRTG